MTLLKAHRLAELFPLLDGDAYREFADDIKRNGVRQPITLYEGKILDGRNRYRAAIETGVDCSTTVFEGKDPVGFVISLNLKRRHLNESQRGMVAAKLATMTVGKKSKRKDIVPIGTISREQAGKLLNVSTRTVARAKTVQEHGAPELIAAVESGTVDLGPAAEAARLPVEQQRAAVAKGAKGVKAAGKKAKRATKEKALGDKIKLDKVALAKAEPIFGVIYADPAWRFEPRSRDTGMDRAADNHYPTSPTDEIVTLKPPAAKNAILFLWATGPMIVDALRVLVEWGFEYRSQIIWRKDRMGTGYWARGFHELLLIGVRGDVPAPAPGDQPDSVIEAPVDDHSVKPAIFYEIIERMFPTMPKLEMFSRSDRPGWEHWGAEAGRPRSPVSPDEPIEVPSILPPKSSVISPVDRCAMGVRSAVLATIDELQPPDWGAVISEVRGELADLELVIEKRRSA